MPPESVPMPMPLLLAAPTPASAMIVALLANSGLSRNLRAVAEDQSDEPVELHGRLTHGSPFYIEFALFILKVRNYLIQSLYWPLKGGGDSTETAGAPEIHCHSQPLPMPLRRT